MGEGEGEGPIRGADVFLSRAASNSFAASKCAEGTLSEEIAACAANQTDGRVGIRDLDYQLTISFVDQVNGYGILRLRHIPEYMPAVTSI